MITCEHKYKVYTEYSDPNRALDDIRKALRDDKPMLAASIVESWYAGLEVQNQVDQAIEFVKQGRCQACKCENLI